ncbi:MAG: DEAD/DEAH box helicase [Bacteroidetes bacterium]|nr:DEAD/DEAH box helicase [Bacteroidota bacterium]
MKKYENRQYQTDCVNFLFKDVLAGFNSLVAVPTGGGKTIILARFIAKYLDHYPDHKIVVLSHTESILLQDFETLQDFFNKPVGLYSSGLKVKEIRQITVAGIQSIYKQGKLFKNTDLIIIDECHTCPTKGRGMYWRFFDVVKCQRVGLTATHFRTGHGYLHEGKGAWFDKLSYDLCTMDNFNKLVDDRYLTKLYCKPPDLQLNVDKVKTTAGDYNLKDLAQTVDRDSITKEAIKELISFGKNYKSWLIFAINIEHADNINRILVKEGINSEVLHSKNNGDRHSITERFKNGKIQSLVTVGMLTTGFDAPNTDLICLLRPTKSPVLHVQMVGRGLRTASDKSHCLVLDFAGNTARLGPINNIQVPIKNKKKGKGQQIVKACVQCGCLFHPTVKVCDVCGYEFIFKEKIKPKFDDKEIVQRNNSQEEWLQVTDVHYKIHHKKDKPDSLRVTYKCGLYTINEYICYDHEGYARKIAENWVKQRFPPDYTFQDVEELYKRSEYLNVPEWILIDTLEKFPNIIDIKFA